MDEIPGVEAEAQGVAELIVRENEPLNLESPFYVLESFLTPNELFYVRNHFPIPRLDASSYRLRIEGAVEKPLTISYDELRAMPSQTAAVTLECAGNGRTFLMPQKSGVQWELGAVGTAEWTGVPLRDLLERAGVSEGAVEVVLEGADQGEPVNIPKPPRPIPFARSLPIAKARCGDVLVAYQMNARDLPIEHGFPIRAIVPGYYGMASVKWLTRIEVITEPFHGYWQTTEYAYWDARGVIPVRRPMHSMMVKSAIARPRMHELIPPDTVYPVFGAAWTGDADITQVEISTDGGDTWETVRLKDDVLPNAWRRWEYEWRTPSNPGKYKVIARAKDSAGSVQGHEHDANYGSYGIHHAVPIQVFVGRSMSAFR